MFMILWQAALQDVNNKRARQTFMSIRARLVMRDGHLSAHPATSTKSRCRRALLIFMAVGFEFDWATKTLPASWNDVIASIMFLPYNACMFLISVFLRQQPVHSYRFTIS